MGKTKAPVEFEVTEVELCRNGCKVTVNSPLWGLRWIPRTENLLMVGGNEDGWGHGRPFACFTPPATRSANGEVTIFHSFVTVPGLPLNMLSPVLGRDGTYTIAAGTMSGGQLWQVEPASAKFTRLATYECPNSDLMPITVSPSGRVMIMAGDDRKIHVVGVLRDGSEWRCVPAAVMEGHAQPITSLAVAPLKPPPDVKIKHDPYRSPPMLVASVSEDNTLRLWRTADFFPAAVSCTDPDNAAELDMACLEQIGDCSGPAGVISMETPPSFKTDDPQMRFKLSLCSFSVNSDRIQVIMTRVEGPTYLVTYTIRWIQEGGRYKLRLKSLASVKIRSDAITSIDYSPCGQYIGFGTSQGVAGISTLTGVPLYTTRACNPDYEEQVQSVALTVTSGKMYLGVALSYELQILEVKLGHSVSFYNFLSTGSVAVVIAGVGVLLEMWDWDMVTDALLTILWNQDRVPRDADAARLLKCNQELAELVGRLTNTASSTANSPFDSYHYVTNADPMADMLIGEAFALVCAAVPFLIFWVTNARWLPTLMVALLTGILLGDTFLQLLPLTPHIGSSPRSLWSSHMALLLWLMILFVFDGVVRLLTNPDEPVELCDDEDEEWPKHIKVVKGSGKLGLSLSGNVITKVVPGSAAEQAGITAGMVVLRVNEMDVSPDQVKEALLKGGAEFTVTMHKLEKMKKNEPDSGANTSQLGSVWFMLTVGTALRYAVSTLSVQTTPVPPHPLWTHHHTAILLCSIFMQLGCLCTVLSNGSHIIMIFFWRVLAIGGGVVGTVMAERYTGLDVMELAALVTPAAAAVCFYVTVIQLMPFVNNSNHIGLVMQVLMLCLGVAMSHVRCFEDGNHCLTQYR